MKTLEKEWPNLRGLGISFQRGSNTEKGIQTLMDSEQLERIRELYILQSDARDGCTQILANSISLRDIETLKMECNYIGDTGTEALAKAKWQKEGNRVDLTANDIPPDSLPIIERFFRERGIEVLLDSPDKRGIFIEEEIIEDIGEYFGEAFVGGNNDDNDYFDIYDDEEDI